MFDPFEAAGVNSVSSKAVDPVDVSKVVQPSDSGQISANGIQKRSLRASSPPSDSMEISSNAILKHGPTETSSPSDSSQISTIGIQKRSLSPRASSPPSDSKEIRSNRVPKHGPPETLTPSNSTKEISGVRILKHGPPETLAPSNSTKETSSIRIQKHGPPDTLPPSVTKEISSTGIPKRAPAASGPARSNMQSINRSIVMPNIVPRDGPGRDSAGSRRESIGSTKASGGMSSRPPHTRMLSTGRLDMERMSVSLESLPSDNVKKPSRKDVSIRNRLFPDSNAKDSSEGKQSITNTVVEKPDRTSLPATTSMLSS